MPETAPADVGTPAQVLADNFGQQYATMLMRAGRAALNDAFTVHPVPPHQVDDVVAAVLSGAFTHVDSDDLRRALTDGIMRGALAGLRDAELAAVADTVRVAYRMASQSPHNPLDGLSRLADRLGVKLDGDGPAEPHGDAGDPVAHLAAVIGEARLRGITAGSYTLARVILDAGYQRTESVDPADMRSLYRKAEAFQFETWAGHEHPAEGTWWGFPIPDLSDAGRLGERCTIECLGRHLEARFTNGAGPIRFGTRRLFRFDPLPRVQP